SPINAGGTTARGVESALALLAGGATLTGSYTFLDMRYDATGMQVAGRPMHDGYVRLDAERRLGRVIAGGGYEVRASAGLFGDPAGTIEFPLRVYHALALRARLDA